MSGVKGIPPKETLKEEASLEGRLFSDLTMTRKK